MKRTRTIVYKYVFIVKRTGRGVKIRKSTTYYIVVIITRSYVYTPDICVFVVLSCIFKLLKKLHLMHY